MNTTLSIAIDSAKADMGVSELIDTYRDLFEQENGRQRIADMMTLLTHKRKRINRQMVEKWFRKSDRTLPSSALLVTLLWACKLLRDEQAETLLREERVRERERVKEEEGQQRRMQRLEFSRDRSTKKKEAA